MDSRILQKYNELAAKYKDVPLSADQRERLHNNLMEEAVEFCFVTEAINKCR